MSKYGHEWFNFIQIEEITYLDIVWEGPFRIKHKMWQTRLLCWLNSHLRFQSETKMFRMLWFIYLNWLIRRKDTDRKGSTAQKQSWTDNERHRHIKRFNWPPFYWYLKLTRINKLQGYKSGEIN